MNDETRKDQITQLVVAYYNKFDFLQNESLDVLIDKTLDRFLNSTLTIEEINNELIRIIVKRKKEINDRFNLDKVKENHEEIYARLDQLVSLLSETDIDYQLAGALCAYLKYEEESNRVHDDIDLNVNENDLDKFREICEKMELDFSDKRMDSPRVLKNGIPCGEHEVIATTPNSKFHVGVFCFQRNEDGSVDNKSYYKDSDGNTCIWDEHLSPELSQLLFGKESIEFNGKKLIITPPESVYGMKQYTKNIKDINDIEFMDGKIDMNKLNEIDSLSKTDRRVDLIKVNNKIDDMFVPEEKKEEKSNNLEKPKVFVKEDNTSNTELDNKGLINYRSYVIPFLVLVVIVILIEIFNFIA